MSENPTTPTAHRARSVRRRLTVYSLVSAALMLIISAVSLTGINHQRQQTERLNAVINPVDDANQQLMQNLLGAQSGLRAYGLIAPRHPGAEAELYRQAFEDRVQAPRDRLDTLDERLGDRNLTDDSGQRTRLLTLQGRQRVAVDGWLDFAGAYLDSQERTELQVLGGQRLFVAVTTANAELQRAVDAERVALQASIREGASRTSEAVIVATVGVLLLVLMAAWRTTVSLTTPLLRLRDTVRRQRLGDRDAWARTDVGAAEVRDLAGDVNALTYAHLRLVDQQATSLALQRAGATIARRTQDAPDPRTALLLYAVGVGRALGADQVVCATLDRQGNFSNGLLWAPAGPRTGAEVPPRWRSEVLRFAAWLWRAEREIVVEDLRDGVPGLPEAFPDVDELFGPTPAARGGLLLVPIGNGDRAMGVIAVRTDRLARAWTDVEVSFARQSAAEVARVIIKAEVDHDRAEYVRQLEQLDRSKDDFLSTVSHELRTPLTSIQGYLEMLEDGDAGDLTPRQLDMLAVIDRNASRLKTLIEDLLVLNRMQTSPGPAGSGDRLSVADLVRQTVEELRPLAAGR